MVAIRRRIQNLPANIKTELKSAGLEIALVDIETAAKSKLTRDRHVLTGNLRASLHTEYANSPLQVLGGIDGDLDWVVGTNCVYAWKIEKIDSYLIWAYKKAKPKFLKACKEAIKKAVNT
jgi:hypothetical protein